MSTRTRLPDRRPSETSFHEWEGHRIAVTVGFDPVTLAPREVFANTEAGGAMQSSIADACVLISIALQYGIDLDALSKSLGRVPAYRLGEEVIAPASPVGTIVDAIREARA